MRKIRLEIDDLAVEFFTAGKDGKNAGTVQGHDDTETCPNLVSRSTCFRSCAMTNGYQYCIDPYC